MSQQQNPVPSPEFPTTRWSVLRRLDASQTQVASAALDTLCRAYRYPIYAYLRRSGHTPEDAEDWTQGFFAYLIERRLANRAAPEKGHFRSFLLASIKNFISTERRKQAALKRGGGLGHVSLDALTVEERYAQEPAAQHTPETLFELSWAREVMARSLAALERDYVRSGNAQDFSLLKPCLYREGEAQSYAAIAAVLGKSEDAIKTAVLRMRQRFQRCLREQLADTVAEAGQVEDELIHLRQIMQR